MDDVILKSFTLSQFDEILTITGYSQDEIDQAKQDIIESISTKLILDSFSKFTSQLREQTKQLLESLSDEEKVHKIVELFNKNNTPQEAQQKLSHYIVESVQEYISILLQEISDKTVKEKINQIVDNFANQTNLNVQQ